MNDTLPSWNDTPTKQAILAFVQAVSDPGSALCAAGRAARRHPAPGLLPVQVITRGTPCNLE
jgi:hypothetical protein